MKSIKVHEIQGHFLSSSTPYIPYMSLCLFNILITSELTVKHLSTCCGTYVPVLHNAVYDPREFSAPFLRKFRLLSASTRLLVLLGLRVAYD